MNAKTSIAIVEGLKQAHVDSVAILPDHGFADVQRMISEDQRFTYIPVSNESIGVGICAGLYLDSKVPAIMIPTSGLLIAV